MKKFRITFRDRKADIQGRLNPTAQSIIVEVENENDLVEKIKEKAQKLIVSYNYSELAYAYIEL